MQWRFVFFGGGGQAGRCERWSVPGGGASETPTSVRVNAVVSHNTAEALPRLRHMQWHAVAGVRIMCRPWCLPLRDMRAD